MRRRAGPDVRSPPVPALKPRPRVVPPLLRILKAPPLRALLLRAPPLRALVLKALALKALALKALALKARRPRARGAPRPMAPELGDVRRSQPLPGDLG